MSQVITRDQAVVLELRIFNKLKILIFNINRANAKFYASFIFAIKRYLLTIFKVLLQQNKKYSVMLKVSQV